MNDVRQSVITTVLIQVFGVISGILLARILLPEARGVLAAVMLWPAVVLYLASFGIQEAVTFLAARDRARSLSVLSAALVSAIPLAVLGLAAGWGVLELVFAGEPSDARGAANLYLAFIPLSLVSLNLVAYFQGTLQYTRWNVLRSSVHVAYAAFVPLAYVLGYGTVKGFVVASLFANVVPIACAIALLRKNAMSLPKPSLSGIRELLGYGARIHAGNVLYLVTQRLDQMFISVALSAFDFGLYVVAFTVSGAGLLVAQTLGVVAFPKISQARDGAGRIAMVRRYMHVGVLLQVPSALALVLIAQWVVALFFGEAYAGAAVIVQILALAGIPLGLRQVLNAAFKGFGEPLAISHAETVTLLALVAGLAAFGSPMGLAGVALAVVVSQAVGLIYLLAKAKGTLSMTVTELLVPTRAEFGDLWRHGKAALTQWSGAGG